MQDFSNFQQGQQPQPAGYSQEEYLLSEAGFFQNVYFWMCGGVLLTALLAMGLASSETWLGIIISFDGVIAKISPLYYVLLVVEFGVVWFMSSRIDEFEPLTAKALFVLYAALNGATISVFIIFTPMAIVFKAFVCASATYGVMAVYGLVTKRSLEGLGGFLYMGLFGLIIAIIINIIFPSGMMSFIISCVAVIIFAGLTAYDHQKLRVIHAGGFEDEDMQDKIVVMGALTLYLDFINLFLHLLRIFASRD